MILCIEQQRLVFWTIEGTGTNGFVGLEKIEKFRCFCAIGASKLEVTFNKAVDADEATISAKKATIVSNIKEITFADDNKSVVIELSNRLTKGDYTVTVSGLTEEAFVNTVTVDNEKVTEIRFMSQNAPLTADAKVVTVPYRVFNQYGENITSTTSGLSFTASGAGASVVSNGTLTITAAADYRVGDVIAVSALHGTTHTFTSTTVTVVARAQVATIDIKSLYHEDNKELSVNSTYNDYALVVDARDQYGNRVAAGNIGADVLVSVSDTTVVDVRKTGDPLVATFETISINGANTDVIKLTSPTTKKAGVAVVNIISKTTGNRATFELNVKAGAEVDELILSAPALAVSGEKFEMPFTAIDQFGVAITKEADLTAGIKSIDVTAANGIYFEQDHVKGLAKLVIDAENLTEAQTIFVTVITGTNKVVQFPISVVAPAAPTVVSNTKDFTRNILKGASVDLKVSNIVVHDQYGRAVDMEDFFGTTDEDYRIFVGTSAASRVELSGDNNVETAAGAATSNFWIEDADEVVTLAGLTKGSSTITLRLQKGDGSADIANSGLTFTSAVIEKADIVSYEVKEFGKLHSSDEVTGDPAVAKYAQTVEVYGVLANGSKVLVPETNNYTVQLVRSAANTSKIVFNDGKITAADDTVFPAEKNELTVTVIVTVDGASTQVISKALTVSSVAPQAQEIYLNSRSNNYVDTNTVAKPGATADVDALRTFLASELRAKDQYGVVIPVGTLVVIPTNLPKNTDGTTKTLNDVAQGESFSATVITENGLTMTIRVIRK